RLAPRLILFFEFTECIADLDQGLLIERSEIAIGDLWKDGSPKRAVHCVKKFYAIPLVHLSLELLIACQFLRKAGDAVFELTLNCLSLLIELYGNNVLAGRQAIRPSCRHDLVDPSFHLFGGAGCS